MQRRFAEVRSLTEALCEPLCVEDHVVQTMADVSPTKWHLAHTTWFFETFVLRPHAPDWSATDSRWQVLFNSYYDAVGRQWERARRGILSRPTVAEVYGYRARVDEAMAGLLAKPDEAIRRLVEIGLQHEQQHQELILTDIKHVFASNPLRPIYREGAASHSQTQAPLLGWRGYDEGIRAIGAGPGGFSFDNERPRHRRLVQAFEMADRLVTAGEWMAFIEAGGYTTPSLWLSAGWQVRGERQWASPLYWERRGEEWWEMTLGGMRPVDPSAPVTHVSLYEADAFATWAGARLPEEAEWEVASADAALEVGNLLDTGHLHPRVGAHDQFFGDVWEWTRSAYSPYPGYRTPEGALGEYNGKFMCNQYVLRGGSCVTSASHVRPTYRNFFPADARWQFSGVRLARDVS